MKQINIHYDCDPGQDDAIALLYALGARVNITSISAVGGNADVKKCTRNILQLLELADRTDIPVYQGAPQPLKRLSRPVPEVTGDCGMAGANLPQPEKNMESVYAPDFLAKSDLPETLVLTGPLTNIALAIQSDPTFTSRVKTLVIMGGCVYPEPVHGRMGNIQVRDSQEWAEYNFFVDPEAAQIVFAAGFETICLIPLEVTQTVLYGHKVDAQLRALNKRVPTVAANILSTIGPKSKCDYAELREFPDDPVRAVHDVVAMSYLIEPEIFITENVPLRIEVGTSPKGAGQSIKDKDTPDHPQVILIKDLNRDAFFNNMINYLDAF